MSHAPKFIQVVAIGIIKKDDRFLMTKRFDPEEGASDYHGMWQFPGGGVEFGESVTECLLRELKEEIGVDMKSIRLLPEIFEEIRGNWHGVLIPYLCEMQNPDDTIVINSEASEFGWFTLEEIKNLNYIPDTIEMVGCAMTM